MKLTAVFEKSQVAARALNMTSDAAINQVLADLADLRGFFKLKLR